jgi:undecaprenyl-diphosphatase
MLNYYQAIIMGALQGVTELFPISSLGHSVILPGLLGWNIKQNDSYFLTFLVATHLATALVLFGFFFKDWIKIISGVIKSVQERQVSDPYAKLGWLLIVGTIPAGLLGVIFEDFFKKFFASPQFAALFLLANGTMLGVAEYLRRRSRTSEEKDPDTRLSKLSYAEVLKVGTAQGLALFPGFSRTGATMTGGLMVGLSHIDAARLSFLLATPIIGAAALLKLPELASPAERGELGQILAGALAAAIAAYFSVRFLTKYFETKTLRPFAFYCLLAGVAMSIFFLVH